MFDDFLFSIETYLSPLWQEHSHIGGWILCFIAVTLFISGFVSIGARERRQEPDPMQHPWGDM